MWCDVGHPLNLKIKLEQEGQRGKRIPFFLVLTEKEKKRGGKRPRLLSTIYEIPLVGFHQAKDKSPLHQ